MRDDIQHLLDAAGGAAPRPWLRRGGIPRSAIDHEVRTGRLVRPFPRSLVRPWDADDLAQRENAALISVGDPVLLSHLTALRRDGLWDALRDLPPDPPVHLSVLASRAPAKRDGIVLHRVTELPPWRRTAGGLPAASSAHAVASSWPLLSEQDRRAAAIVAVRKRLVTPEQLRTATGRLTRMAGRKDLLNLVDLLAAGCESELEIWGRTAVFDVPGLDHGVAQRWIQAWGRRYRLDRAYEDERVAVEMDGDTYHSTREQRERDRRRDSALGSIDWLTLRFSRDRMFKDIAGVRAETLATLAARRR